MIPNTYTQRGASAGHNGKKFTRQRVDAQSARLASGEDQCIVHGSSSLLEFG